MPIYEPKKSLLALIANLPKKDVSAARLLRADLTKEGNNTLTLPELVVKKKLEFVENKIVAITDVDPSAVDLRTFFVDPPFGATLTGSQILGLLAPAQGEAPETTAKKIKLRALVNAFVSGNRANDMRLVAAAISTQGNPNDLTTTALITVRRQAQIAALNADPTAANLRAYFTVIPFALNLTRTQIELLIPATLAPDANDYNAKRSVLLALIATLPESNAGQALQDAIGDGQLLTATALTLARRQAQIVAANAGPTGQDLVAILATVPVFSDNATKDQLIELVDQLPHAIDAEKAFLALIIEALPVDVASNPISGQLLRAALQANADIPASLILASMQIGAMADDPSAEQLRKFFVAPPFGAALTRDEILVLLYDVPGEALETAAKRIKLRALVNVLAPSNQANDMGLIAAAVANATIGNQFNLSATKLVMQKKIIIMTDDPTAEQLRSFLVDPPFVAGLTGNAILNIIAGVVGESREVSAKRSNLYALVTALITEGQGAQPLDIGVKVAHGYGNPNDLSATGLIRQLKFTALNTLVDKEKQEALMMITAISQAHKAATLDNVKKDPSTLAELTSEIKTPDSKASGAELIEPPAPDEIAILTEHKSSDNKLFYIVSRADLATLNAHNDILHGIVGDLPVGIKGVSKDNKLYPGIVVYLLLHGNPVIETLMPPAELLISKFLIPTIISGPADTRWTRLITSMLSLTPMRRIPVNAGPALDTYTLGELRLKLTADNAIETLTGAAPPFDVEEMLYIELLSSVLGFEKLASNEALSPEATEFLVQLNANALANQPPGNSDAKRFLELVYRVRDPDPFANFKVCVAALSDAQYGDFKRVAEAARLNLSDKIVNVQVAQPLQRAQL